jgi:hypothetical protein
MTMKLKENKTMTMKSMMKKRPKTQSIHRKRTDCCRRGARSLISSKQQMAVRKK